MQSANLYIPLTLIKLGKKCVSLLLKIDLGRNKLLYFVCSEVRYEHSRSTATYPSSSYYVSYSTEILERYKDWCLW